MLLSTPSVPRNVKPTERFSARDYIDYGWHIIPVSRNKIPLVKGWTQRQPTLDEFPVGCRISQVTGPQLDGTFVIGPEFDHKPEDNIDATANYQAFLSRISDGLFSKLHITRSTGGNGYHIRAQVPRPVNASIIRSAAGKKIGDLRSAGGHLVIQDPDKWIHGAPWTMDALTDAELDELLAALNYQAPVTPATSTLDWSAAKSIHVPSMLTDGIPSRFRPTCQGAHYLRNTIPARRTSEIRYALIEEMVRCEYTDEQVAALALHLADFGTIERKGITWLENDVDRIVRKIRASGPRSTRKPKQTQTQIEIDATGRPLHKHERPYLFWAASAAVAGKVLMDRNERAAAYGVSVRTLDRIETHLITVGKIQRGLSHDRRIAWVELLPEPHTSGTAKPSDTHIELEATTGVYGVGGVGEGGNAAAPEKPLLAHVVEDALEVLGDTRIRKHRAAVILGIVRSEIPDANEEAVAWHVKHAVEWRRQRRADETMRDKLAVLTTTQLKTKLRGLGGKVADLHKQDKPGQAWVFGRIAYFVQQELDKPHRVAELDKGKRVKVIQKMLGGVL